MGNSPSGGDEEDDGVDIKTSPRPPPLSVPLVATIVSFLHTKDHVACALVARHWLDACKQRLSWFPDRSLADLVPNDVWTPPLPSQFGRLGKLHKSLGATLSRYTFTHLHYVAAAELKGMQQLADASLTELRWDNCLEWFLASRHLDWIGRQSPNVTQLHLGTVCLNDRHWDTLVSCTSNLVELRISLCMMPSLVRVRASQGHQAWPRLERLRLNLAPAWMVQTSFVVKSCVPLAHLIVELTGETSKPTSWDSKQAMSLLIKSCTRLQTCSVETGRYLLPEMVATARPLTDLRIQVGLGMHWCGRQDAALFRLVARLGSLRTLQVSASTSFSHSNRIPLSLGHQLARLTSLHLLQISHLRPTHFTDAVSGILHMPRLRDLKVIECLWSYSCVAGHVCDKPWPRRPRKNVWYYLCRGGDQEGRVCNTRGLCRSVFGSGRYPAHLCVWIR